MRSKGISGAIATGFGKKKFGRHYNGIHASDRMILPGKLLMHKRNGGNEYDEL